MIYQSINKYSAGSYHSVSAKFSEEIRFDSVFLTIKSSSFISKQIGKLRSLKQNGLLEDARKFKQDLPCVTFSAIAVNERKPENIVQYNNIVVLDFDHIPSELMESVRNTIINTEYTACVFTSPSGDGLKVLVRVNSNLEEHKTAFRQVCEYYARLTGIEPDKSGSDPLRLCILSSDSDIYVDEYSNVFQVDLNEVNEKTVKSGQLKINAGNFRELLEFIFNETTNEASYEEGNRNNFIHHFTCNLNRGGVPLDAALAFSLDCFSDFPQSELSQVVKGVYQRNVAEYGSRDYEVQMLTQPKDLDSELNTPLIPDAVYESLPHFFKNSSMIFKDKRERDVFFTSFLGIVSGCLNRVYGIYRGKRVYPNLFTYIVAPAGSNKGVMEFARMVGLKYHKHLMELNKVAEMEYQQKLDQYNLDKKNGIVGDLPERPLGKRFFIAGNSSSSAMLRQIQENDGAGVVCESEGDTIGNMLKQDWGNFSEIFRKAFHHEFISINRKEREECHEIDMVKLSVVITSTPDQVGGIIQSAENGMFSRFLFYLFGATPNWVDMDMAEDEFSLSDHFTSLGHSLMELINKFAALDTKISLQSQHKEMINDFGRRWMKEVAAFVDVEATAVVKRFGLIMFRMCMIFTAVRNFDNLGNNSSEFVCNDEDAQNALIITETLIEHSLLMFKMLPKNGKTEINNQMKIFYELLPEKFPRKDCIQTAARLGLKVPTVDKYLSRLQKHGYLQQPKYGFYEKTNRIKYINRIN